MPDKVSGGLMQAIARVQQSVVVPKDKYNEFGRFRYRSFEDIVAALKKPCADAGVGFYMDDEVVGVGDRYYVKATVHVFLVDDPGEELRACAYAREADHKNGSDDAQVTGMASSYARKYALCGVFDIDGERDPDEVEGARPKEPPVGEFVARCRSCGRRYTFPDARTYEEFVANPGCCSAPQWEVE